jgi:hypothetical protein
VARVSVPRSSSSRPQKEKPNFLGRVIAILFFIGIIVYGFGEYSRRPVSLPAATGRIESVTQLPVKSEFQGASSGYQCDGRTHCSQMTSCAEAKYFLRNCPNVEMDGDNDGVPCEMQWCTHPLAK